jgi:hypothetical protein
MDNCDYTTKDVTRLVAVAESITAKIKAGKQGIEWTPGVPTINELDVALAPFRPDSDAEVIEDTTEAALHEETTTGD